MSTPDTNGEKKGLMYVSAFWPIIAGVVVVTYSLATSISSVASLSKDEEAGKDRMHKLEGEMSTVRAENEVSKIERAESRNQLGKLQDQYAGLKSGLDSEIATRGNAFTEVETQIDSVSQSVGIQFASAQRHEEGVSNALHELGAKFPEAAPGPWYFPNISNRRNSK